MAAVTLPTNNLQNIFPVTTSPYIGLKQINDFKMVREFSDSDGRHWKLAKSARDSSVEIPDPQFVQVTDYWMHEFPGSGGKVYIYVVEGIKRPRIDTEQAVMVLYQWFSTSNTRNFTPQMISPGEWLCANVYTAPISDSRVSKLKALCNVIENSPQKGQMDDQDIDISLIRGERDIRRGDTETN